ncbi:MAG: hypothetical protein GTO54_07120 [Nitrososphaeria archaeon]|nr:hypothetical protein [Nitrososphaeria archaeon]
MTAIDSVVDQLNDGEWHNLQDLAKDLKLTPEKLQQIIQFLRNLELIELDEKQQEAQMNTDLKQLIPT